MNQETINGALSLLIVAVINAATYLLSRRAGKQDTKDVKVDVQESTKSYVDQLVTQLQSGLAECAKRTDAAEEQVRLLNLRTTDLEKQIIDLTGQNAAGKQEVVRVEGERDTAIAERNTLRELPEQENKSVELFVEQVLVLLKKHLPAAPITIASPEAGASEPAATDATEGSEAA